MRQRRAAALPPGRRGVQQQVGAQQQAVTAPSTQVRRKRGVVVPQG
eukprot:gene24469-2695_t